MLRINKINFLLTSAVLLLGSTSAYGLDPEKMYHFRSGEKREWDRYSNARDASKFLDSFNWSKPEEGATLKLSQVDVKQRWQVSVNGSPVGKLVQDENPMTVFFEIEPDILKEGLNRLEVINIERNPKGSDDIVIGRMEVLPQSIDELVNETQLTVIVTEDDQLSPARITILNAHGELQTVGAESNATLAVRPGTVYTSDGVAKFGLPEGKYTIYAGRGFEYSLPSQVVEIKQQDEQKILFSLERQVDTTGYVACDTHVHTRTHSGHGDSTVQERMITLAGEGVELPIATDHNVQIDHRPFANEMNVKQYFTPVTGNEVTTPVGHFNIFPATADQKLPNHKLKDWSAIFTEIERATHAPIVILNHARDVHSGVTPFAPKNHLSIVGENLNGWPIGFNAMEVINSGATQTDPLQLTHDWMNLLNAGHRITPVGSSDSHDVARHFVGQGRSYIRCDDSDPGKIDIDKAVTAFKNGDVAVSYGLLALLDIQETDIKPNSIEASVDVRGPDWSECDRIRIFANGILVSDLKGNHFHLPGQKGHRVIAKVYLKKPQHDTVFVAVATGPGIEKPYWKTAFPYQPDDDSLNLNVLGLSRAVWYDADKDGTTLSAKDYAEVIFNQSKGDLSGMLARLTEFDETVAVHVAHLYQKSGGSFESDEYRNALSKCDPSVKKAFEKYFSNWRASQVAQLKTD